MDYRTMDYWTMDYRTMDYRAMDHRTMNYRAMDYQIEFFLAIRLSEINYQPGKLGKLSDKGF